MILLVLLMSALAFCPLRTNGNNDYVNLNFDDKTIGWTIIHATEQKKNNKSKMPKNKNCKYKKYSTTTLHHI